VSVERGEGNSRKSSNKLFIQKPFMGTRAFDGGKRDVHKRRRLAKEGVPKFERRKGNGYQFPKICMGSERGLQKLRFLKDVVCERP
jgi:hypothetical protein